MKTLTNTQKKQVSKVLNQWYKDGFATWTSQGSGDGEDGLWGGSFHDISSLKEVGSSFFKQLLENDRKFEKFLDYTNFFSVDFGSSNSAHAYTDLEKRLKNYKLYRYNKFIALRKR